MNKTTVALLLGIVLALGEGRSHAVASTPMEQIQQTVQQVLAVVNGASTTTEDEIREKLREALMPRFDWVEMAKQALGKHWDSEPGRQEEFVVAFAEFLGKSYVGTIGSYKDEKIEFVHQSIENDLAQVDTKIVSAKGAPTTVNYRLRRVEEEWKIYDVIIEDISLVGNYRSQFGRILKNGSMDELLARLQEKMQN